MSSSSFRWAHWLRTLGLIPLTALALLGTWATGGGGGSVQDIVEEVLSMPMHTAVAAGDVDRDGLLDVVSVSNTLDPERIHANVFLQQLGGPGAFATKTEYLAGTDPSLRSEYVVLADLNQDDRLDIVVSHRGVGVTGGNPPGNQISVWLQDPLDDGQFVDPVFHEVGNLPVGVAVGDLDLDGLPDVVVATRDGLYLLRQDGGNSGTLLPAAQLSTARSEAVQIGDVDNDGLPDLASTRNQGVQIHLNNPANVGNFLNGQVFATGGSPTDLALSDLDDDGRLDIAVANYRSSSNEDRGSVAVLLQDPIRIGEFAEFTEYAVNQALRVNSVAVADLNGDQHPDIVAAIQATSDSDDKVVVLLQSAAGQGAFTFPVGYSHSGENDPPRAIVAGLGPDTLPDLVLANALDGIYAFYQDSAGIGTFGAATKIGE